MADDNVEKELWLGYCPGTASTLGLHTRITASPPGRQVFTKNYTVQKLGTVAQAHRSSTLELRQEGPQVKESLGCTGCLVSFLKKKKNRVVNSLKC